MTTRLAESCCRIEIHRSYVFKHSNKLRSNCTRCASLGALHYALCHFCSLEENYGIHASDLILAEDICNFNHFLFVTTDRGVRISSRSKYLRIIIDFPRTNRKSTDYFSPGFYFCKNEHCLHPTKIHLSS